MASFSIDLFSFVRFPQIPYLRRQEYEIKRSQWGASFDVW